MKTYFIFSDVHGEFDGLISGLKSKGFDETNPDHILFSLGDLWDRGLKNYEVAEYLIKFWELGRFIGVMGNHDTFYEEFILDPSNLWNIVHNGFGETLNGWAGTKFPHYLLGELFETDIRPKIFNRLPKLRKFIASFVDKVEFGKYIFTHGGYSKNKFTGQWEVNNWAKTPIFIENFDPKDKVYVFGHWSGAYLIEQIEGRKTHFGEMYISEHFIGIDSTSAVSKKVNVLVLKEIDKEFVLEIA